MNVRQFFLKICVVHLLIFINFGYAKEVKLDSDNRGERRASVEPRGFLYGIGMNFNQQIYKDYDQRVTPLPIIGYRGKRLKVYGPFVSYDTHKLNNLTLSLKLAPRFDGYSEEDGKIFEGMEERKFSFDGGFGIRYEYNDWKASLSGMHDILGRSEGYEFSFGLSKVLRIGPIFIEPSVSMSYLDKNYVDYYYGVQSHEANFDRSVFSGSDALNSKVGVAIATPIFFGGLTRVVIDNMYYDESITASPLTTEKDSSYSIMLMFSKHF
ncbi:MipA/OmpV family protein [Pleionea sediminis]|uniref:MipA/OmpV family protein n=1 Tax=Pleionea sediminis TaxID=2569479 RepID=UPI00197BBC2D|nr:MipA/OmpV family protein [Pleionea sediminis]